MTPTTASSLQPAAVFQMQRAQAPVLNQTTSSQRKAKLRRLESFLLDTAKMNGLFEALKADFNKPRAEVLLSEISVVLQHLRHTRSHLRRWMQVQAVDAPLMLTGVSTQMYYEAKGVCLILAPWNYPFNLSISPLVDAIAAGNTVILKPSEMAPHTAAFITQMISELFPPHEVAVIEGDAETARALLELPFDHIFFTGSPKVGKLVMAAAAKHLSSVTLELGGKSPVVIDQTAHIAQQAYRLAWAKSLNKGQTCIAPDYVLVHTSVKDAFIEAYKKALKKLYPTDNLQASPDYCRIVNTAHTHRLHQLYTDALNKGAKEVVGGNWNLADRFIPPTLLTDLTADMHILQEEIFGPILPMLTYQHPDEVIAHIRSNPKPLTLYICSEDKKFTEQILRNTSSGSAVINDFMLSFASPELGFGGVNNSGIGRYMGFEGFQTFSNKKPVLKRRFLELSMIYPPYTNTVEKLLQFLGRWIA